MYNFYNLNPNHSLESSNSSGITLSVNEPLHNENFYKLFSDYFYDNSSEEKQDLLAEHLNSIDYLIGFYIDDMDSSIECIDSITIHPNDNLNLLISTTENREVYLPAFTDIRELKKFTNEPIVTLRIPAEWLWKFILSQKNFSGIVFNPGTIGWDISLEHIISLLNDITQA